MTGLAKMTMEMNDVCQVCNIIYPSDENGDELCHICTAEMYMFYMQTFKTVLLDRYYFSTTAGQQLVQDYIVYCSDFEDKEISKLLKAIAGDTAKIKKVDNGN